MDAACFRAHVVVQLVCSARGEASEVACTLLTSKSWHAARRDRRGPRNMCTDCTPWCPALQHGLQQGHSMVRGAAGKPCPASYLDAQPCLCCPALPVTGVNHGTRLVVPSVVKHHLLAVYRGGAHPHLKVLEDDAAGRGRAEAGVRAAATPLVVRAERHEPDCG